VPHLLATRPLGAGPAPERGAASGSVELDESSQAGNPAIVFWQFGGPPFPFCLAGSSSILPQLARATRRIKVVMIPYAVNFLVTLAWGSIPWVHCLAACSKVHSTHDAAVAITDMAAASMLPRQLVEQANTLAESGARLSNNANRQQFHVALLEDCSFFAHLVLRYVRAGGNQSSCLLDRDSPQKKSNVTKVSQTQPRSSSNLLPRHLPVEERTLQPEAPSSFLPTLWVEVGCRHAQTLGFRKELS